MKAKILKTSKVGKKLAALKIRGDESLVAQKELAEELNVKQWRQAYWTVWGGMSCVMFNDGVIVNTKVWKKADDGYFPKANTKIGKEIIKKIEALPNVRTEEMNACLNHNTPFGNFGISFSHPKYFLLDIQDAWSEDLPKDCKEITIAAYKSLVNETTVSKLTK